MTLYTPTTGETRPMLYTPNYRDSHYTPQLQVRHNPIHLSYSEKHEGKHRPEFHKGVVIKINANQRYATTAATMVVIREVARKAGVPLQDFVVKNDSPCGSTIGPIMSAKLGIPTIDLGAAQLSMHSIREMCETTSVYHTTALFKALFEEYPSVMASIQM
ncbi:Aspartyl aminopeptidase [Lamellibrachia satsuma]|nr:Aspartyl aminopeptidase [Lamellibrachia satsuma]